MITFKNQRNPVLPVAYHIPDSEAHVMPDGRLYVYGSFDDREDVYCSEKYHVLSTSDMENWVLHDVSLSGRDIPWFDDPDVPKYPGIDWAHPTPFIQKMLAGMFNDGTDDKGNGTADGSTDGTDDKENGTADGGMGGAGAKENGTADGGAAMKEKLEQQENPALLFAPDCIYKDGKYYLYFCMADNSEGVAISDRPEGPFKAPLQLPCGGIDPAIFIDDDGQAYYYWGQLFSHGVKLNPDMISFESGDVQDNLVTEETHFFHEGSSMRKIGDTYYYVYADMERGKPTALGYATGKAPLGPFTYRGIIIDNDGCDPQSWNNHGSIECVNGQWYVFYHRSSRNSQQHRRLCIEKLTIAPDGSIPEVKMTSQGIGEPFGPGEELMGYQACGLRGTCYIDVNRDVATNAGYPEKLVDVSAGDEIIFRYIRSGTEINKCLVNGQGSAKIAVLLENTAGASFEAGTIEIVDGEQVSENICAEPGEYEVRLRMDSADNFELLGMKFGYCSESGIPFDFCLPTAKPVVIGNMTQAQLDEELMNGIESLKTGVTYSSDEVDAELAKEFGI